MKHLYIALLAALFVTCGCETVTPPATTPPQATAVNINPNPLFSDNMILQRDLRNPVWGTANPSGRLFITIDNKTITAVANEKGHWKAELPPLSAGGPYTMEIQGQNAKTTVNNIMVGDIWLCAGQSNMHWDMRGVNNAAAEIAAAKYPDIRLFQVPRTASETPLNATPGKWQPCTPETVKNFSAVGYFFGRDLYKELNIPIGLINVSWASTQAESWIDRSWLRKNPNLKPILDRHEKLMKEYPVKQAEYEKFMAGNKDTSVVDMMYYNDPGEGIANGWEKTDFNDEKWEKIPLPTMWEDVGMDIDGVVWFRKTITIPPNWQGKELELSLGPIDDFDRTYVNGVKVGGLGKEHPEAWRTPRYYRIPADLVKNGKAVIAIRVFDRYGGGGFGGTTDEMALRVKNGSERISLNGEWKYAVAIALKPKTVANQLPYGPKHPSLVGGLYNGMINPLIPFGIKGAVWYQGENNVSRAWQYFTLQTLMIDCWRTAWNQGDFPFLIVQLANYHRANREPADSVWAELRESQTIVSEKTPRCALAVTIDIGSANDQHPKNKQEVGRRLALAAMKIAYDRDVIFSGPSYLANEIKDNKMIITFTNIGSGLEAKNGALKRFQIAGDDQKFVWADAKIEGLDKVIVSSPAVPKPTAVRYAWSDNPEGCNLYNKEGLPAVPFRTDDWRPITLNVR